MIELLTLTHSPEFAARCDQLPGMRLFVDLERNGKAERQQGRNTFISSHTVTDVGHVKAVLKQAKVMVRVNPIDLANLAACNAEVNAVLAQGADMLMLPMFSTPAELQAFAALVAGRVPVVALLETAGALASLDDWIGIHGLQEVFVGLNDLHVSLGCQFMFEPLLLGHVDRVAAAAKAHGLRFGFGGIARVDEGLLPGRDVLAEHVRLGSRAVILSRSFNQAAGQSGSDATRAPFEQAVGQLRAAERALVLRTPQQILDDQARTFAQISKLSDSFQTAKAAA